MAKILQSFFANQHHSDDELFRVNNHVMLATLHRCRKYKNRGHDHVAKFFPQYDGPYTITRAHPETSSYKLHLPNSPNIFPVFHSSLLKRHIPNDPHLFPSCEHPPVLTKNGQEEWTIEHIIDSRKRGRGTQYLNSWLPSRELTDCEALDIWLKGNGQN